MRILGIDPGSSVTGYGLLERVDAKLVHLVSGTLRPRKSQELSVRLAAIQSGLAEVIEGYAPDLAVANSSAQTVVILDNDGSGSFTAMVTVTGQAGARGLTAGDWEGDGDIDLAVANFSAANVAILINDGRGDFE